MTTYSIVRFYQNGRKPRIMQTGLTLEEAKAHCDKPSTRGKGWFDGFIKE